MKKNSLSLIFLMVSMLWGTSALAFTNLDLFESIIGAHQDESKPKGMDYISEVKQAPGTYNTWNMLFRTRIKDHETGKKRVIGMPTTLKYAGNKLYIKIHLADVDRRVYQAVMDDLEGTVEDLKNYDSGDLEGFKSNIGHNGKYVLLEGYINVAGKSLEDIRDIIVELRSEMSDFYEDLYESNIDALADYFDDVLDKNYKEVPDVQTFVEIMGNDFTQKNQVKNRESKKGHWAWDVDGTTVETINEGDKFREVIQLKTGTGISAYKTEKMYDELTTRVRARLPKGANSFVVEPHPRLSGITSLSFDFVYSKKTDGVDIQGYHKRFADYVKSVKPDLDEIIKPYIQAPVKQKVITLAAKDFMALIDDGLQSLPIHEVKGAKGQWKFKYKNVAYIITNFKHHMMLSFIFTLTDSDQFEGGVELLENEIETSYPSFADKYAVHSYKTSPRTVQVDMLIKYGVLSSTDVTGKKIKEKYHYFTRNLAPALQAKLKAYAGM
jgi:hypothetical protein